MARAKPRSVYSVHPGVTMVQSWVVSLPEKTGRSLDEWIRLVQKVGPSSEKERRDWLKAHHGLGTNTAWWIAERASGKSREEDDPDSYLKAAESYVAEMFAGKKAGLRPIFDELLKLGMALGRDVKSLSVQDNRPPLSTARLRPDQAVNQPAYRPGSSSRRHLDARAADRHRRAGQERSDHPPNLDRNPG